jgi:RNA polymerase sigma-70 factor (ECF subfamily)
VEEGILSSCEQARLAESVRSHDARAEEEVARLFRPRVLAMMLARTRDWDASRDLTQDVMLAVITALRAGALREPEKLAGFIQGTARNLANNHLRSREIRKSREDALSPELEDVLAEPPHGADAETAERDRILREVLRKLDATDQTILFMTLMEGRKPADIACRLGLTSDLVRQRKSRAVTKVAGFIKKLSRSGGSLHLISERSAE